MRIRPLLLVDVDGVISLFGFEAATPPPGRLALVDGVPHLLSIQTAERLKVLQEGFDCAWCTGWEERADELLPFVVDAPRGSPHVPIDASAGPGRSVAGHWKLAAIDRFAGRDRPLAWIDDAHDDACHAWAQARPGPTLLVTTDPAVGLTDEDADALRAFGSINGTEPA
jgi:hypothetical protein